MARPLFYTVRRIVRGPRRAIWSVQVVRAVVKSKSRAIAIARKESSEKDVFNEIDVVGISVRNDRFVEVSKVATFVAGSGGHAIRG